MKVELEGVVEFDDLVAGLDRLPRLRQCKLKPWIDVDLRPADGQDVQLTARKHAAGGNSPIISILEFRGVLVTHGKDAENR